MNGLGCYGHSPPSERGGVDSVSEQITSVERVAAPARRVAFWPALAAALLSVIGVAVLKGVDYSTSSIFRVGDAEVQAVPAGVQVVGSLRWDFDVYARSEHLAAFREVFQPRCGSERGVPAARCVTTLLLEASPHGQGRTEFVDANFDPARALREHMAGAPGNCTARSAMAVTALLSMGVPARVVQLLPAERSGHNALEVYDAEQGWVLFDPLFDSSYLVGGKFASALAVSGATGDVTWRRPHEGAPNPNEFAGATVQYPEPWLYTRIGERCASWPYRACFAQAGPAQFRYGPLQRALVMTILAGGLFAAVWALRFALDRRQAARP
ncbi:MAG: transglutaminase-like domain-containing protein [Archangium sp.]